MSQFRIRVQGIAGGSAARAAEESAAAAGTVPVRRIQAGSAARMAEEAKRAGAADRVQGAAFSMRAQGGAVERTSLRAGSSPARTQPPTPAQPDAPAHQGAQEECAVLTPSPAVANQGSIDRASLQPSAAGRLKTFFRGLFLPEEPPQP